MWTLACVNLFRAVLAIEFKTLSALPRRRHESGATATAVSLFKQVDYMRLTQWSSSFSRATSYPSVP